MDRPGLTGEDLERNSAPADGKYTLLLMQGEHVRYKLDAIHKDEGGSRYGWIGREHRQVCRGYGLPALSERGSRRRT